MAKIKGIELKNIRTGFGHDGGGLQASIYVDGNRVGKVLDDGWGGGNLYTYTTPDAESELKQRMRQYFDQYPDRFEELDIFIYEVYSLALREKEFKKMQKKGTYKAILYFPSFWKNESTLVHEKMYLIADPEDAPKIAAKEVRTEYRVYASLEDFVIE